jgi:chemotaxis signal transduction protein
MNEANTAEKLRREFDLAFRDPRAGVVERSEDFLAVRIGGDPFAIRVLDIAGLYVDRAIVPMPSTRPALLGLARFRSAIAPVFDLRVLLGYPPGAASRWLIVVRAPELVGLSFDLFESHAGGEVVDGTLNTEGVMRPLVAIGAIVEKIKKER